MLKKSANDPKQYQSLTLENGLRVLLIKNDKAKKSAAALAINVGHFHDPIDRQGLSHFLEHLLFLGTKNFPHSGDYHKYIKQHGGSHNAWSGTEHTCFFFDITAVHFSHALERFSELFIAPLLTNECIIKERENIDAEFTLKLKDDIKRLYDVHKDTINPLHPFAKFSVGNLDTLADRNGDSISQELHDFFQEHYCAERMTLVLEGPQSLTELRELAERYFRVIKSTKYPLISIKDPLYLPENQKIKIDICPVKDDNQLIISFAMEGIDQYYQDKPESIIAYLLGHEGKGSILSLLKKKQWALALTAGSGINGSNFKDFNINIVLTSLGETHINEIIEIVFSYIALLNKTGIDNYFYQEKQKMNHLAFLFHETSKPLDNVSQLAINMQHYPEEDYIFGDYIMLNMSKKNINKMLSYLQVDNMRVVHISPHNHFSQKSFWYQVPFHITPFSASQLNHWRNIALNNSPNSQTYNQHLFLPEPNPYIIDLPTIPLTANDLPASGLPTAPPLHQQASSRITPKKIIHKKGLDVWHIQDNSFKVPKGYIYIGVDSPIVVKSIANIAMTRLLVNLYKDKVIEENYNAELAGIHYTLYAHQAGVTLKLSGYSEKQHLLLASLLKRLVNHRVTEQHFLLFKEKLMSYWLSSRQSKPISQLFGHLHSIMQPNSPTNEALAQAINQISFTQYQEFTQQLFKKIKIDMLIHGNGSINDAQQLSAIVEHTFKDSLDNAYTVQCPVTDIVKKQTLLLPINIPEQDHACVFYTALNKKDSHTTALTMLTSHILSPLFFQKMRTENQYGYLVGVGYVPINHYPGITFYIQSPHCNAYTLTQAIDDFIDKAIVEIENISQEQWHHLLHGLASQLQEKDNNMRMRSQRFWAAICNKDDTFTQKKDLLSAVLALTLTQVKSFIKTSLMKACQPDRFILYASDEQQNNETKIMGEEIKNITLFLKKIPVKY